MRRVMCLALLVAFGGLSLAGATYQAPPQAPRGKVPRIQQVKDSLYVIGSADPNAGSWTGGNTAVFITENGVVLVDTKFPGYGQQILDQVKSVTGKPVTTIINTHTHQDHTGSNIEFSPTVEFVAHENTKASFSRATCLPVTNCQAFKGENAKFLPKRTFKDKMSLFSGKDQVDLYYFGRGHTNGDAWVVFPAVRAMHTGDMFQRKNIPSVNTDENGGSGVAFSQTLAKAVAGIKNVDTVIPGHSNTILSWVDFRDFADFYKDFLTTVQNGIKAGQTAEATAKAYRIPEMYKDKGYSSDKPELHDQRVKVLVQAIYKELKK